MQEINIFIASSCEMTDWRNAIGNAIRQWSDIYEPLGYRIRMLCWEDYNPGFTGVRKQTEYNEDLIKNSHLFFCLFRSRCGGYTQEEVKVACSLTPLVHNSHIIVDNTGIQSDELREFLVNPPLSLTEFEDVVKAIGLIYSKVQAYIQTLPRLLPDKNNLETFNIYSTIGIDLKHKVHEMGNLIRSVDTHAEKLMSVRCRLLENNFAEIDRSDYYIALLKDKLSDKEEYEIIRALDQTGPKSHPQQSVLYYNHDDNVLKSYSKVSQKILSAGAFNEPREDNNQRIKYNLMIWLLSKRVLVINENAGLEVSNGWVKLMGLPLIRTTDLKLVGSTDDELLLNLIKNISDRLLTSGSANVTVDGKFDIDAFKADLHKLDKVSDVAKEITDRVNSERLSKLWIIDSRLEYLKENDERNKRDIVELTILKEKLQECLLVVGSYDVRAVLRTKIDIVRLFDDYGKEYFINEFDEDSQYYSIYTLADKYSILDPVVEAMRMNYGNACNRVYKKSDALKLYRTSLKNLSKMNDGSRLMVSYIVPVYLHLIHELRELSLNDQALPYLKEFEELVNVYKEQNPDSVLAKVYEITVLDLWLLFYKEVADYEVKLTRAFKIWGQIAVDRMIVPEEYWDDVYCHFPTAIAASVIDALDMYPSNIQRMQDVVILLEQAIQILSANQTIKPSLRCFHMGQFYHNLSKLYSFKPEMVDKARECGVKSLQYRKDLYKLQPNEDHKFGIANIMLMIGATYINNRSESLSPKESKEALGYADESYEIFKSLDTEGYLGPKTKVYEAHLLQGTILLLTPGRVEEGFAIIKECYEWNLQHPSNDYETIFTSEYHRLKKIYEDSPGS